MRIAFDASALLFRQMGIANYVRCLLPAIESMAAEEEFLLLLNSFRGGFDRIAGQLPASPPFHLRLTRVPARVWHRLFLDWRCPVDLLTGPADIFHSPDCIAPRLLRGRTVITVHDMLDFVMPELFPARLRDPWFVHHYQTRQQLVRRSVAGADHVIAVSENTRADIERHLGVSKDKVSVIPYGVAPIFHPIPDREDRRGVLRRYGLNEDGFLLSVGRMEDRKNCDALFRALRKLIDRHVEVPPLVVCGWYAHPAETDDALRILSELRLDHVVRLIDYVPAEDLPYFYSSARVLVYPSFYEGFGLPPLEAMACGTPVVASNASSVPEVVGDAALCTDPRDLDGLAAAIERATWDQNLWEELRRKGLARASMFSWERAARTTMDVYLRVASG